MLSVASNTVMSAMLAAGGDGGGHGLPAGQPFGFQTELAAVAENPSLSIAQWIIWLPAISAALCGLYAALGVKGRLPGYTTVAALAGAFICALVTYLRLDPANSQIGRAHV